MTVSRRLFILISIFGLCAVFIILLSTTQDVIDEHSQTKGNATINNDTTTNYREFVRNQYQVYAIEMPASMTFAGESIPISNLDIKERLDREFHINTYWHSQTFLFHKRSYRWFPIIERILQEEGVPDDFKYLCLIESGLANVTSPSGAAGFWQFMKKTAIDYQLEVNEFIDERFHLEKATKAACEYLKKAKIQFKSWTLAAASYNMGKTGLNNRLREQKVASYYDLHLNSETSRYVMRIIAAKYILSESEFYGFKLRDKDVYRPYLVKKKMISKSVPDLYDFALKNNTTYRILKVLNPWILGSSLPITEAKNYEVILPKNNGLLNEENQDFKHD
ncbi:MAG: lytic transglycosylase domain-containing protein [Flavobacteriales bacterium]|nr:lytic transglycosylase domain-containing protein [Flavobacteriales bacterium]